MGVNAACERASPGAVTPSGGERPSMKRRGAAPGSSITGGRCPAEANATLPLSATASRRGCCTNQPANRSVNQSRDSTGRSRQEGLTSWDDADRGPDRRPSSHRCPYNRSHVFAQRPQAEAAAHEVGAAVGQVVQPVLEVRLWPSVSAYASSHSLAARTIGVSSSAEKRRHGPFGTRAGRILPVRHRVAIQPLVGSIRSRTGGT
jgi:hypothetical protein